MSVFSETLELRDEAFAQIFEQDYFSSSAQMYHDFRAVFLNGAASEAQCRKVLAALCVMGGAFSSPEVQVTDEKGFGTGVDVNGTLIQLGRADMINRILRVLSFDPTGREPPATSYEPEEPDDAD